jgi:hypothetical protein
MGSQTTQRNGRKPRTSWVASGSITTRPHPSNLTGPCRTRSEEAPMLPRRVVCVADDDGGSLGGAEGDGARLAQQITHPILRDRTRALMQGCVSTENPRRIEGLPMWRTAEHHHNPAAQSIDARAGPDCEALTAKRRQSHTSHPSHQTKRNHLGWIQRRRSLWRTSGVSGANPSAALRPHATSDWRRIDAPRR